MIRKALENPSWLSQKSKLPSPYKGPNVKSSKPKAFMSYAHVDNKYGQLTEFRDRLSNEIHVQTGEEFPIFQDRDDIRLGQSWHQRIKTALQTEITFLIPILTPSFFKSEACREELSLFLDRERAIQRNDLIFPIYYVGCRILDDEQLRPADPLATTIATRQWADWRGLRFEPFDSQQSCKAIMQIASQIAVAIEQIPIVPLSPSKDRTVKADNKEFRGIATSKGVSVFVAYAHADERMADQLKVHLMVLLRNGIIDRIHERVISAGEQQWSGEISNAVNQAQVILFLVSADFLVSDYCYDVEVRSALERHSAGEALVIPIILRACDWGGALFAKVQASPLDGRPISSFTSRDKAWLEVMQGIKEAIKLMTYEKAPETATSPVTLKNK